MKKRRRRRRSRCRIDPFRVICWIIVPVLVAALAVLDAFGLYTFTTERLIVFGVLLSVLILPLFSEITVKDVSVKRKDKDA